MKNKACAPCAKTGRKKKKMNKKMKSIAMLLCAALLLICLTGCQKTCSVSGCKLDVYKDKMCQYHYELVNVGQAIDDAISSLLK